MTLSSKPGPKAGSRKSRPISLRIGDPECPASLSKEGKRIFRSISKPLAEMGLVSVADSLVLGVLADSVEVYELSKKHLQEEGYTSAGSTANTVISPWFKIHEAARNAILQIAGDFALTPKARRPFMREIGDELGAAPNAETIPEEIGNLIALRHPGK